MERDREKRFYEGRRNSERVETRNKKNCDSVKRMRKPHIIFTSGPRTGILIPSRLLHRQGEGS